MYLALTILYSAMVLSTIYASVLGQTSSIADEIVVAMCVPVIAILVLMRRSISIPPRIILYIGGYFAIGIISSILSSVGGSGFNKYAAMAEATVLEAKPFVIALLIALLVRDQSPKFDARKFLLSLIAVALINTLFVLVNLVTDVGIYGQNLRNIAGLSVPTGMFFHKVSSASVLLIGVLAGLSLWQFDSRRVALGMVTILLSVVLLLHVSLKETLAMAIGYAIIGWNVARLHHKVLIVMSILPIGIATVGTVVAETSVFSYASQRTASLFDSDENPTVRNLLYNKSGQIAADHVPLGSGLGTFASSPSRSERYSPIYWRYGLSRIYGATPRNSRYLQDAFWPKVLGETGFIGLFLYIAILVALIRQHWRRWKHFRTPEAAFFLVSVFGMFVTSIASSPFTQSYFLVIFGAAIGAMRAPIQGAHRQGAAILPPPRAENRPSFAP